MGVRTSTTAHYRSAKDEIEAILERSGDGLSDADFESLYHHYLPKVAAFAASRGAEDPEAIANTALLRTHTTFDRLQTRRERSFEAYVFRTAHRGILAEARRSTPPPVREPMPEEDPAPAVVNQVIVSDLLDQLTPDQRAVIQARFFDDLTAVETAERLGKSPNAVEQLQHRALIRFRVLLLGLAAILVAMAGVASSARITRIEDRQPATTVPTTVPVTTSTTIPVPTTPAPSPDTPFSQASTTTTQPNLEPNPIEPEPRPDDPTPAAPAAPTNSPAPAPIDGTAPPSPTATTTTPQTTTSRPTTAAPTTTSPPTTARPTTAPPTTAPPTAPVPVENPAISLVKKVNAMRGYTKVSDVDFDANTAPGPEFGYQESLHFTYIVENTGDVTLTNVMVIDDTLGMITCPETTLDPGQSMTCRATKNPGTPIGSVFMEADTKGTSPAGTVVTDNDPVNFTITGDCFKNGNRYANGSTFVAKSGQWWVSFICEDNYHFSI